MRRYLIVTVVLLILSSPSFSICPFSDFTGDCKVDFKDFAVLAEKWLLDYQVDDLSLLSSEWLTEGIPIGPQGMVWVSITDPGVAGHEAFDGYMCKYEITNSQYCKFLNEALASGDIYVSNDTVYGASGLYSGQSYCYLLGSGTSAHGATNGGASRINWDDSTFSVDPGYESHPVTYVSWYGATAFADYYGWRLPTEWEWQAVADNDGTFSYGCGTKINTSMANYNNSVHPDGTTIVGAFGEYGYGLADMAGNLWEWTASCYSENCSDGFRVFRGGSWSYANTYCWASYRAKSYPHYMQNDIGFRVCR